MIGTTLHARMVELHQRYKDALGAHKLGAAGLVRDEAEQLLAEEWEQVIEALDLWAHPLAHGSTPTERAAGDVDKVPF
jgi:hypothetical protein